MLNADLLGQRTFLLNIGKSPGKLLNLEPLKRLNVVYYNFLGWRMFFKRAHSRILKFINPNKTMKSPVFNTAICDYLSIFVSLSASNCCILS